MGKSSPTKLQLKHIPDVVVLETVLCLQNQWRAKITSILKDEGYSLYRMPGNRLSFSKMRTAHLDDIVAALRPLPEKLVWRKLQKLEDQGRLHSYGPSSTHYRVEMDNK